MSETILVTGGAGYIGSHICKKLSETSHKIIVVDDLSSGYDWAVPKNAEFYKISLGDFENIKNILKEHNVQSVIHMAAKVDVAESVENPILYFENNVVQSMTFMNACVQSNVKNFIFSSTAAVYGSPDKIPVSETAPLKPENPYGLSKLMGEQILQSLCQKYLMNFMILRYFNVAGAALDGTLGQATANATHLIKVVCETACSKRKSMSVYGNDYKTPDGTGVRDFIHVEDLADIHIQALNHLNQTQNSEILNCGYGKGYSVLEIINTIKKISNTDFVVKIENRRPGDVAKVLADNSKLLKTLSWQPKYNDISIICESAYKWEKQLSDKS